MNLIDNPNLIEEFKSYVISLKDAMLSLKSEDLRRYIASVNHIAADTLASILTLLSTYTPAHIMEIIPAKFGELGHNLEEWRESILVRLKNDQKSVTIMDDSTLEQYREADI